MIKTVRIGNFRCLKDLELSFDGTGPFLILGKNGSGKSSVRDVFSILSDICRGGRPVDSLLSEMDVTFKEKDPIRFQITVEISGREITYHIAVRISEAGPPAVVSEALLVDGKKVFERDKQTLHFWEADESKKEQVPLSIQASYAALPMIEPVHKEPVATFRDLFANGWIIAPEPSAMEDVVNGRKADSLHPSCHNLCAVLFSECEREDVVGEVAILMEVAAAMRHLTQDLERLEFRLVGNNMYQLFFMFSGDRDYETPFHRLSDGQKCYFVGAVLTAFAKHNLVSFCYWDEPDNFLALNEVQGFVRDLRKLSLPMICTSHHPKTIQSFPSRFIHVLTRHQQTEASEIKPVNAFDRCFDDIADAVAHGEVGF